MKLTKEHRLQRVLRPNATEADRRKRDNDPQGIVICVAVMRRDLVFTLPAPARHKDLHESMIDVGMQPHPGDVEGFMTIFGFKDRIMAGKLIGFSGRLTSDDLW